MKRNSTGRLALIAWALALIGVAVAVSQPGKGGKLYPTFVAAGEHVRNGERVYGEIPSDQDQYRYSPLVAVAFAPWAELPMPIGAVLWRWLQAAVFLLALRGWSRVTIPHVPFPALALLCLPLVLGNVFNAQLNPLVAALLLAGLTAFARERYWLAAMSVAAATAFKVYPLAIGLLLCVIEPRRFGSRLILAVLVGFALPFAFQSPDYVSQQFADWFERVRVDDRTAQPIERGYHDVQKLLRRWGKPTSLDTYRGTEVLAGCVAAGLVYASRRQRRSRARQVQACGGLGLVWCTLFGPATESATYSLLAPIATYAVHAVTGRSLLERVWVRGAYLLLLSVPVALWFSRPISDPYRAMIPQAHGALMLLAWLVWREGWLPKLWGQTSRSVRMGVAVASRSANLLLQRPSSR
jgi:Glycosyltransferase family 87